jgi:hypothetical protein
MNRAFIACLFTAWLLTGCVVFDTSDAGGFTSREQIRADSYVAQEHERTLARMAEAQAKVDQEAAKQAGQNHRAATWAMILPVLAIIAGACVLGYRLIEWRGRIHMARMKLGAPPTQYQQWRAIALQHRAELKIVHNRPVLILPDGRKMLVEKVK